VAYTSDILLGRITKISGFGGGVTVKLEKSFSGKSDHIESVFLEIEGRPVPFFISEYEFSGADILKVRFEGYDSSEKVSEFVGCRVFLTSSTRPAEKEKDPESLAGYRILTEENSLLGTVKEVISNPGQLLLNVSSPEDKEILIPLHDDFIVEIDREKKVLIMNIPEGLTEIN
jgi:16S rRNA processing protein RimM